MIQRVQTIYMLLAGVLSLCSLFMPMAYFSSTSGELFDLYASGLHIASGEMIQRSIYLLVLVVASAVLPFVTIFLFKDLMLQIRLCVVECVLLLGVYAMIGAYYYLSTRMYGDAVDVRGFHPALFAPLAAFVASGMAARSAFQDLLLLRSVDRIR